MLQAAAEYYGFDSPLVPKISTGFCGGVSRTKGMCGAVSGGVMALGIIFGRTSADITADNAYENVQEFLRIFKQEYGSLNCFELTGCDLGDAEGLKRFRTGGIQDRCREYTGSAARVAAGIIGRAAPGSGQVNNLEDIRQRIDTIDSEIIKLLAQRGGLVSEAGKLKKSEDEVRAADRVEKVIENVKQRAVSSGLDPLIAEKIYRTIIDCFINKEMTEFRGGKGASVKVYSKDQLPLRSNVPGAKMWAVALEKSMLTYFEMEPNTVFPEHSHEAEQITLVLDGELVFSFDGKQVALKVGDVVAIPSNVKHYVSTGKDGCRAVDAWSPVRKEYLP